jgi:hypothetical protein
VKKLYYSIGGLFTILIIVTMAIFSNQPTQNLEVETATPTEEVSPTQVSTEVLSPIPPPAIQPTNPPILPHTVNGYTAMIEPYYADISQIIFHVRVTGGGVDFGEERYFSRVSSPDIYDENGNMINASGGLAPAADPSLFEMVFEPVTLLKGDHIKGQLAFDIVDQPDYNKKLAQFSFDFDIPLHPEVRFYPKQTVTANGLEILLDSVTVTPSYTQIYLCLPPPSFAPWTIGVQTTLQIDEQEVLLFTASGLFSSATGSYWGTRSEPYWVPPVKNGNCYKIGFQAGSTNPTSLTLTIPSLEKLELEVAFMDQLAANYPGMSIREAYSKYLEEHGNTYKGPWVFNVELTP